MTTSTKQEAERFWRKNVRPGTTFGQYSRQRTPWQKLYDWLFRKAAP